jgi:hypothetical protein
VLTNGELVIDRTPWTRGKDRQSLIPLSDTTFAGHFGRRMRFDKDDQGVVSRLIFEAPEPHLSDLVVTRQTGVQKVGTKCARSLSGRACKVHSHVVSFASETSSC